MTLRGTLPQPHRYTAGILLPRALREGINSFSTHPLQPEMNSCPGPKDYGLFPGGTSPSFQRTESREVGIWTWPPGKPPTYCVEASLGGKTAAPSPFLGSPAPRWGPRDSAWSDFKAKGRQFLLPLSSHWQKLGTPQWALFGNGPGLCPRAWVSAFL